MTIQQLEYILAVDQFRHFARAAEYCRVTQPTLSAMIQKLEEELGVKLFDRTMQPVCPTRIGEKVIAQARTILTQASQVKDIINEEQGTLTGTLSVATFFPADDGEISRAGYPYDRNEDTGYPPGFTYRRYRCCYSGKCVRGCGFVRGDPFL